MLEDPNSSPAKDRLSSSVSLAVDEPEDPWSVLLVLRVSDTMKHMG